MTAADLYFEKHMWDRGVTAGLASMPSDIHIVTSCACIWEVVARKVGNVHINSRFADMSLVDFLTSAVAIIPAISNRHRKSVGKIVEWATQDTQAMTGRNTNLGIVLLLAPLSLVKEKRRMLTTPRQSGEFDFRKQLPAILKRTSIDDAAYVFNAIRHVNPGGIGETREQDVCERPTVTLLEAMKLAADRDLIARQYANNYADVFDLGVPALLEGFAKFNCVEAAVIHCQLKWMSVFPDSLIVRKLGLAAGETVRKWAEDIMLVGGLETAEGRAAGVALDAYLRSDGNKLNPGTTADLVCACLFVALREGKLKLNAPFPWTVEDWL
ncbi:triphosphoribosyl-dephospho-CoA synthase [soil metagenome]